MNQNEQENFGGLSAKQELFLQIFCTKNHLVHLKEVQGMYHVPLKIFTKKKKKKKTSSYVQEMSKECATYLSQNCLHLKSSLTFEIQFKNV